MRFGERTTLLSIFSILIFAAACGDYHRDYQPTNFDEGALNNKGATLNYALMQSAVFQPFCVKCHSNAGGNKGNVNLETYINVFAAKMTVAECIQKGDMPKNSPPLPARPKQMVLAWLAAGAPETSNLPLPKKPVGKPPPPVPPPPPPVDGEALDFRVVSAQIFQPYCVRCHNSMNDYNFVKTNIDKIHDNVDWGKMPKNEPPLVNDLQKMLVDWITAGLPEGPPP